MNQEQISGKWKDIKGEIRNQWGKLTDEDLERVKGNIESIGGLIQERYGQAKEDVSRKLSSILDRFKGDAADATQNAKDSMRESRYTNKH